VTAFFSGVLIMLTAVFGVTIFENHPAFLAVWTVGCLVGFFGMARWEARREVRK